MPIRKDLKQYYGPEWKKVIRPRILARENHQCAICAVPNHQFVLRGPQGAWRLDRPGEHWVTLEAGSPTIAPLGWFPSRIRTVYIVLTVAHLNNTPGDDREENLKALCGYCHLSLDKPVHKQSRAVRKDKSRPLLALAQDESTIDLPRANDHTWKEDV